VNRLVVKLKPMIQWSMRDLKSRQAELKYRLEHGLPEPTPKSRHTVRQRANRAKGLCQCGKVPVTKARCQTCIDAHKRSRDAVRALVLAAYGGQCECCGESIPEFLAIDHINNDGKQDRQRLGGSTTVVYRWLRNHGFPKDRYRLLCHNCNLARQFYGQCPHYNPFVMG
jgi:hypothetical protein